MKKKWELKGEVPWHVPEKLKKVMKLTAILTLALNVSVLAAVNAQHQKVTLEMRGASAEQIFAAIGEQTNLQFFYNHEQLAGKNAANVSYKNTEVEKVLDDLGEKLVFSYRFTDNYVVITPRQQNPGQQAQVRTPLVITGKVVDASGKPLAGASVIIKGATIATTSDANGAFTLRYARTGDAPVVLVIAFLGYKSQEVAYRAGSPANIVLQEETAVVDNVVVTGIFNKPKESYTGAVSTITAKELAAYRGQNLIQTLANIDPAINMIINNDMGSNPNTLPQINMRGNSTLPMSVQDYNSEYSNAINSPLIIMDGFEISLQKLMDYNDDEIESINLLKDAAATAIYGSRGANGVIVIISKAPKAGKLRINVQANYTVEMPDLTTYDLLSASELLALQKYVGLYDSPSPDTNNAYQSTYELRLKNVLEGVDTDWLHYPVRTGLTQRYNVRLEGGSEEFRWGTSVGYNDVAGVMKGSERSTFNGAVTLSYRFKNLIFQNQLNIGVNKGVESPYGTFSTWANMRPYERPYDEAGKLNKSFLGRYTNSGLPTANPLYDAGLNTRDDSRYTEIVNNLSMDWTILPELTARLRFGISKKNNESDYYLPPSHSAFDTSTYQTDDGYFRKGQYTYGTGNAVNYEGSATISYSKTFNEKHSLYAGFDFSIQNTDSYAYRIIVEGFTNDSQNFFGNALQYQQSGIPYGTESTSRRVGYTGNVNYSYDNRYHVDFSLRMDGSSQFGIDNRFAPFWSVGAGWSVHREEFLKDNNLINSLRMKVSYGSTGSQNFSAYQALPTYSYFTSDKYLNRGGAYLMAMGNDQLKWQATDQFNTGLEISILKDRLAGDLDVYTKKTSNLLSSMNLPHSTGYPSFIDNVGEVKNNGFEASLRGYLIRNNEKNIVWQVSGKIAYNKNRITKLSDAIKEQSEKLKAQNVDANNNPINVSTLFYEGYSQNSIWVVRSLGIDPSTGQELFFDKDGNVTTVWNPNAKVYAGIAEPLYRGNLSSMLRYKNFTFNLSFGYQWGGQVYNQTLINKVEVSNYTILDRNVDRRVLSQRWQKPGDVVFYRGYYDSNAPATRGTSRFVTDENVFQLQSASLQYRLDKGKFLRSAHMQQLTFSINMSDLFYISTVKRERGTSYPYARSVGMSIAATF